MPNIFRVFLISLGVSLSVHAQEAEKPQAVVRYFQPNLRIYFDLGSDEADEVDIYNDGSISPTINLLELYYRYPVNNFLANGKFSCGPVMGVGLSAPADDSEDGASNGGDAPVLMLTAGGLALFELRENMSFGIETGLALGISADEGFENITDLAIYTGIGVKFDF